MLRAFAIAALISLCLGSCQSKHAKRKEQVQNRPAKRPAALADPWIYSPEWSTLCVGTPAADIPADVTAQISMAAAGVTVYQITGLDSSGAEITDARGNVISNFITNVDVVNYTSLMPPSFIVNTEGTRVKTIRADHQGAQIASTMFGLHVRVSADGMLVAQAGSHAAQPGDGAPGADLFVTNLSASGPCQSAWITQQNFVPAVGGGASGIPLTNPSWDSAKGAYLIAYAPGGPNSSLPPNVYSVYSDGSASPYPAVEPADGCQGFLYHKTRMDYAWPYLVFAQRASSSAGLHSCGDLVDLRNGNTIEFGDGTGTTDQTKWQIYYNHDDQALDGQRWLMNASRATGGIALATLLDANGNFILGSNKPVSAANPAGYQRINGAPPQPRVQAEWCDLQPDGKALCTTGSGNDTGGVTANGNALPRGCFPAYTIDPATGAVRFLTCTDGNKTFRYEGTAAVRWSYQDAAGLYHALFRSDKSGTPQVYEVVYAP